MSNTQKVTPCRSCGAPMRFVRTIKGRQMPIDANAVADGNVVLEERPDGVMAVSYDGTKHRGMQRFTSHFSTCPNASQHSRAR